MPTDSMEDCSCHEAATSVPPVVAPLGAPGVDVLPQASASVNAAVAIASVFSPRSLARDRFIRVLPLCLDSVRAGYRTGSYPPVAFFPVTSGARVRRRQAASP